MVNQIAEQEKYLKELIVSKEKSIGADHPDLLEPLNALAVLLTQHDRYVEAEYLFRRALEISENLHSPNDRTLAVSLNNLAFVLEKQGHVRDAEVLYRRLLLIREGVPDNESAIAETLTGLASTLERLGRYSEAEPLYRRVLVIRERILGSDHPDVAMSLNNLAFCLADAGRISDAEPVYRRAVEILLSQLRMTGEAHPNLGFLLGVYNHVLEEVGRTQEEIDVHLKELGEKYGVPLVRKSG